MQASNLGLISCIFGAILFLVSFFVMLPLFNQYLISLFIMFLSVVMIAVGFANIERTDNETQTSA